MKNESQAVILMVNVELHWINLIAGVEGGSFK